MKSQENIQNDVEGLIKQSMQECANESGNVQLNANLLDRINKKICDARKIEYTVLSSKVTKEFSREQDGEITIEFAVENKWGI